MYFELQDATRKYYKAAGSPNDLRMQKNRTAKQYGFFGPSDWSRTGDNAVGIVGGIMSPLALAAWRRNRSGMTKRGRRFSRRPENAKKPHCQAVRFLWSE